MCKTPQQTINAALLAAAEQITYLLLLLLLFLLLFLVLLLPTPFPLTPLRTPAAAAATGHNAGSPENPIAAAAINTGTAAATCPGNTGGCRRGRPPDPGLQLSLEAVLDALVLLPQGAKLELAGGSASRKLGL